MKHSANTAAKAGRKPSSAWQPGQSGNPKCKPKGARHRLTVLTESLLSGEVEAIVRRLIDGALAGDATCLRLCVERLAPIRKDAPITLDIPRLSKPVDVADAIAAIKFAVAHGEITPSEGLTMANLMEVQRRVLETVDLAARIEALEAKPV